MSPITIAIPCHRDAYFFAKALKSVLAQGVPPQEILILDDSADGFARAFANAAPHVRYLHNTPPLGMVDNWNRYLREAKTDLVCVLHGDDMLAPYYVETTARLAEQHPEAAAYFCEAHIVNTEDRPAFSLRDYCKRFFWPKGNPARMEGEEGLQALLRYNFIITPSLCYRRSRLSGMFDSRWPLCADWAFTLHQLLAGNALVGHRAKAIYYRRHGASATGLYKYSLSRQQDDFGILDEMSRLASGKGWKRAARTAARRPLHRLHALLAAGICLAHARIAPARQIFRLAVKSG